MNVLPENFADTNVCIIGLGYVGLTLAVAMAERGFKVLGIEINPEVHHALEQHHAHFSENGLDKVLAQQLKAGNLRVATAIPPQNNSTVYIITVGTPVIDGGVNLNSIKKVTEQIAQNLKAHDLIILRSTVKVGTAQNVVKPILDSANVPYCLAMCPERTLEGKALHELANLPQIVGGIDAESTQRAALIFSMLTPSVVRVSSLETAELAKLVNNTQRDLMFAFANEVALMAEALNVNVNEVIHAANFQYPRSSVAKPGLVGGPCLEKDPYIYAESVAHTDFVPEIALAGRRLNENLVKLAVEKVHHLAQQESWFNNKKFKIAVLGLAFKGIPETDDLRGSLAIPLIAALKKTFPQAQIVGYDQVVPSEKINELGIEPAHSSKEALQDAHLAWLQNNHTQFTRDEFLNDVSHMAKQAILYDFWNSLNAQRLENDIAYYSLGWGKIK